MAEGGLGIRLRSAEGRRPWQFTMKANTFPRPRLHGGERERYTLEFPVGGGGGGHLLMLPPPPVLACMGVRRPERWVG